MHGREHRSLVGMISYGVGIWLQVKVLLSVETPGGQFSTKASDLFTPPSSVPELARDSHLRLVTHFKFSIVGPDQKMVTKQLYNWSPGPILGAFCTIFRARPVGMGLGAKFDWKPDLCR